MRVDSSWPTSEAVDLDLNKGNGLGVSIYIKQKRLGVLFIDNGGMGQKMKR